MRTNLHIPWNQKLHVLWRILSVVNYHHTFCFHTIQCPVESTHNYSVVNLCSCTELDSIAYCFRTVHQCWAHSNQNCLCFVNWSSFWNLIAFYYYYVTSIEFLMACNSNWMCSSYIYSWLQSAIAVDGAIIRTSRLCILQDSYTHRATVNLSLCRTSALPLNGW